MFTLGFILPSLTLASFDVSLRYGSKGDKVIELQDFLTDQGVYNGKLDGRFGLIVRKAVVAFQLKNSLQGDGYFGLVSRNKANIILEAELQPSMDAEKLETGIISPVVKDNPNIVPNNIDIKNNVSSEDILPLMPLLKANINTIVVPSPDVPISSK